MDASPRAVLVIEDEKDIRSLLLFQLRKEGYAALGAADGEEGMKLFAEKRPDLVILDLMLPGMDGMAVCRRLRGDPENGDIPIIMLTARSGENDVVSGLEAGADDYVAKPFSAKILMARVRTLLRRRTGEADCEAGDSLSASGITLIPSRREAMVDGRRLDLTEGEYRTLQVLVRRPGVVFSRSQLLDLVRGVLHAVTERAVDVQMSGLRKKLGDAGDRVETVRGAGYRLRRE